MNNKNKEGSFYASKVRLFLNEYGGENLQEFCHAENVSYTKMCHCLGRPAYRKPKATPTVSTGDKSHASDTLLPVIDLQPLVVDPNKHVYHISWESFVYLMEALRQLNKEEEIDEVDENDYFSETEDEDEDLSYIGVSNN